ncbi:hypothetical protein TRFO_16691 [Tritrichomonas foetus]|uniref:Uncharacterized protein n=1 Tax=Tritrichomonas foetus TaxID=1144522 RepID=A0A1J4KUR7_9EUKA|nr:hypothetical protein TRFO_16691 [Tritrichomonas foetus]|eukprot:OHT13245.1 hypothetical protein TRFO_16691 [Tritrichomonas foetus]
MKSKYSFFKPLTKQDKKKAYVNQLKHILEIYEPALALLLKSENDPSKYKNKLILLLSQVESKNSVTNKINNISKFTQMLNSHRNIFNFHDHYDVVKFYEQVTLEITKNNNYDYSQNEMGQDFLNFCSIRWLIWEFGKVINSPELFLLSLPLIYQLSNINHELDLLIDYYIPLIILTETNFNHNLIFLEFISKELEMNFCKYQDSEFILNSLFNVKIFDLNVETEYKAFQFFTYCYSIFKNKICVSQRDNILLSMMMLFPKKSKFYTIMFYLVLNEASKNFSYKKLGDFLNSQDIYDHNDFLKLHLCFSKSENSFSQEALITILKYAFSSSILAKTAEQILFMLPNDVFTKLAEVFRSFISRAIQFIILSFHICKYKYRRERLIRIINKLHQLKNHKLCFIVETTISSSNLIANNRHFFNNIKVDEEKIYVKFLYEITGYPLISFDVKNIINNIPGKIPIKPIQRNSKLEYLEISDKTIKNKFEEHLKLISSK